MGGLWKSALISEVRNCSYSWKNTINNCLNKQIVKFNRNWGFSHNYLASDEWNRPLQTVAQLICCGAGTHCYFPHSFSPLLWRTQGQFTISMTPKFKLNPEVFLDWRQKTFLNVPCHPSVLTVHLRRQNRSHPPAWLSFKWRDTGGTGMSLKHSGTTGPGNSGTQGKSQKHRQTRLKITRVLLWGCKGSVAKLFWQKSRKIKAVFYSCSTKSALQNHKIYSMRRGAGSTILWLQLYSFMEQWISALQRTKVLTVSIFYLKFKLKDLGLKLNWTFSKILSVKSTI